jgi:hypothetical protein
MNDDEVTCYAVSFGNAGENDKNTIVLTGVDLVLPLEMDLDGDPLHDDEVRLRSSNGFFERVLLVSDDDVEKDFERSIASYRFRAVPLGIYDVATRIAGVWIDVLRGLVVKKTGVFVHDERVDADKTKQRPAETPDDIARLDEVPDEDAQDPDAPLYVDQTLDLDDSELV